MLDDDGRTADLGARPQLAPIQPRGLVNGAVVKHGFAFVEEGVLDVIPAALGNIGQFQVAYLRGGDDADVVKLRLSSKAYP